MDKNHQISRTPSHDSLFLIYRSRSAFTLIEVLLVSIILLLISLPLGFAYFRFHEKQTVQLTSEKVVSYLRDAQNNSVLSKKALQYGVRINPDSLMMLDYPQPPFGRTIDTFPLPANITLSHELNSGKNTLIFAKLTGQPDSAGILQISSRHYKTTITITEGGQIAASSLATL